MYGPRQVGKTTGIKLLIKDLLTRTSPENVIYIDLDYVVSPQEFRNLMEAVVARGRNREQVYLFLDEATSVEE